jgi:hypothetical protein
MDCTATCTPADGSDTAEAPTEDWSALIAELTDVHDMSQSQIAAYCDCGQTTISDLLRRDTKDPRWRIGERLRALRSAKRREAAEKSVSTPAPGGGAGAGLAAAAGG